MSRDNVRFAIESYGGLDDRARANGRRSALDNKMQRKRNVSLLIHTLRARGVESPDLLADALNAEGIGTGAGRAHPWTAVQVARLLSRLVPSQTAGQEL